MKSSRPSSAAPVRKAKPKDKDRKVVVVAPPRPAPENRARPKSAGLFREVTDRDTELKVCIDMDV